MNAFGGKYPKLVSANLKHSEAYFKDAVIIDLSFVMDSLNELLMKAILKNDLKSVKLYLKKDDSGCSVSINKILSNGMTLIGAAAKTGSVSTVQSLMDFSMLREKQLHLDLCNENRQDKESKLLKLDIEGNSSANTNTRKKQNIGYFVICRDTEELDEGDTPDGMEALEWDLEVDQNDKSIDEQSNSTDVNIYRWYADILSRSAVMLQSPEHDLARLDGHGLSVLHYAAIANNPHLLEYLLCTCPFLSIDQPSNQGLTPLHLAASCASFSTVQFLLTHKASVIRVSHERQTALHIAAERNSADVVDLLLQWGAEVNVTDLQDRSPLTLAVTAGQIEVVRTLIRAGARLNVEESDGFTPLKRAVTNNQTEIVQLLLDGGARIIHSHYLIHNVVINNNVQLVRVLVKFSPILLNSRDNHGNTPLLVACIHSSLAAAAELLRLGADPNLPNTLSGLTALHCCVQHVSNDELFHCFVDLLVEYEVNLDAVSCQGPPLWYAVVLERSAEAAVLIQHGANVHFWDDRTYCDILSLARRHRDLCLVQLLVYAGYSIRDSTKPLRNDEYHYEFLSRTRNVPLNLRDICRINIRSTMGSKKLVYRINQLPLPELLKKYLCFHIL